jgi:hypothetical protein
MCVNVLYNFRETEKKLISAAATVTSGSGTGIAMKIHAAVAASTTPEASVKIRKTGALRTALYR